jgi:hypothetical protein
MCRDRESIERLNRATDELVAVCQHLCLDDLGLSLRIIYDHVLDEGIKPEEQQLVDKLQ